MIVKQVLPEKNRYMEEICDILLTEEEIAKRVAELGAAITQDYHDILSPDTPLIIVGMLKGVTIFVADLMRQLQLPVHLYFIDIESKSENTRATGLIELDAKLGDAIAGQHVLFIEDMVDAGLSLSYVLRMLGLRKPLTLEVCTMFNKSNNRIMDIPIKYVGFELQDKYVVGYGLDSNELYRNLPFLATLNAQ
ncbi:MAG: hypoxanthine phosphoribosyltransferase [Chloroflexota bacterium]